MKNSKYLILRRVVQVLIMFLYFAANAYGWKIVEGTFGASILFGKIPLADPFNIAQILATGFVVGVDVLIGGLIIIAFYALIGGRVFCSWVCPVNIVTDAANYLRRKLGLDSLETNYRFIKRSTRYWIAGIIILVSALTGVAAFEVFSPITIMQRGIIFGFGMGAAVLFAIFLFDLFGVKNGWCGHLCPLGATYSLIGNFGFVRISHSHENCTNCMKCKIVCPENQVLHMIYKESISVTSGECTNCGRCVDVCDDNALKFDLRRFIKKD